MNENIDLTSPVGYYTSGEELIPHILAAKATNLVRVCEILNRGIWYIDGTDAGFLSREVDSVKSVLITDWKMIWIEHDTIFNKCSPLTDAERKEILLGLIT